VEDVVHDTSHVDEWLRARRAAEAAAAAAAAQAVINDSKARYARSLWRPLLAGAAGAAIVAAIVYCAPTFIPRMYVTDHVVSRDITVDHIVPRDVPVEVPHITTRDVTVDAPHVVQRDVTVDVPHVVPHDVTVEVPRIVPRNMPFDVPVPAPKPVAQAPATAPAPATPKPMSESDFKKSPDWKSADLRGRITGPNDQGGFDVNDDGTIKHWGCLVQYDHATGKAVRDASGHVMCDTTVKEDVSVIIGKLAACHPNPDERDLFICNYLDDDGVEKRIPIVPTSAAKADPPITGSGAGDPAAGLPPAEPAKVCDGKACFGDPTYSVYSEAEFKAFPGYRDATVKGHIASALLAANHVTLSGDNGHSYTLRYDGQRFYDLLNLIGQPAFCDPEIGHPHACFALDKNGHVVDLLWMVS
jgi:hypothetical protein